MCDTTDMEKLRILTMWECGKSTAEIAKAVKKSARTVQRWLAHQKKEGNMDKKPRGLRPRKTTPEEDAKIIKLVKENPELTQKEILTICNLNIYKGTLRRRIQEANGIYKIDLFGKSGQSKKRPGSRKKKAEEHLNIRSSPEPIVTEAKDDLGALETIENEEIQMKTDCPGMTTTESLLQTLQGSDIEDMNSSKEMECLAYDDNNFEDAYETVATNEEETLFAMPDVVKQTFDNVSQVYEGFATDQDNVIVEILETSDSIASESMQTVSVMEEYKEDLVAQQNEESHADEEVCNENTEDIVKSRKKRGRKTKVTTSEDVEVDEGIETAIMLNDMLNGKNRRVKTEVSYAEEPQEGDTADEDEAECNGKETIKKRGRKRKSVERKSETKQERKQRIKKEKIDWEKDRKDTTDIEKKKILIMAECGMTTEDIARHLKKSRRTVQRWISKHNKGLDMEKKERGRRPRKTTPEEDAKIVQLVKEHPHLSRKEILKLANINLHKVTLKNRLNEAGMFFNSQGEKILDFTEKSEANAKNRVPDLHKSEDDESDEKLNNCVTLTTTADLTNAILSCPTLSTAFIITHPDKNTTILNEVNLHGSVNLQGDLSEPGTASFQDYTMY